MKGRNVMQYSVAIDADGQIVYIAEDARLIELQLIREPRADVIIETFFSIASLWEYLREKGYKSAL